MLQKHLLSLSDKYRWVSLESIINYIRFVNVAGFHPFIVKYLQHIIGLLKDVKYFFLTSRYSLLTACKSHGAAVQQGPCKYSKEMQGLLP